MAERHPDAVELVTGAQLYELDTIAMGKWYRFAPAEDALGLVNLRRAVGLTLLKMSNPDNAVIIATAGNKALSASKPGLLDDT
jgi:hypothetical protein